VSFPDPRPLPSSEPKLRALFDKLATHGPLLVVVHVSFRGGDVRCAADLYLPEDAPAAGVVMGQSVHMVKEALAPHTEYLVRAGFAVLAIDYRTISTSEARSGTSTKCTTRSPTCRPEVRSTRTGSACGATASAPP
jgi:hypothetical protein